MEGAGGHPGGGEGELIIFLISIKLIIYQQKYFLSNKSEIVISLVYYYITV
jgi:hypothetical protein